MGKKRLKIAIVTMQLGVGYRHGTERYVRTLSKALRGRGHEVKVLAGDPRGESQTGGFGSPVLGEPGAGAYPTSGWMAVLGSASAEAENWLAVERPDIVHFANPAQVGISLGHTAKRLGLPVVVTMMDFWWVCPRGTLMYRGESFCTGAPGWRTCLQCISHDHPRKVMRFFGHLPDFLASIGLLAYGSRAMARGLPPGDIARWTRRRSFLTEFLREVDGIIFPSEATRDAIQPMLDHDEWKMIPYGLEAQWFQTAPVPRARCESANQLVIGFVGSLQYHKAPHLLLKALRKLGWNETRTTLAGSEDAPKYLAELKQEAEGLSVEFRGALGDVELRELLRSLDILVLPSLWAENLPFVLLEAQAARVPVLASDVPGIRERIPDQRLLFRPNDAVSLAIALEGFLHDSNYQPPLTPLSVDEMAERTEAVYSRAIRRLGRAK